MKHHRTGCVVAVTLASLGAIAGLSAAGQSSQAAGSAHAVTAAQFERWKTELSNWGRWGNDDQIGALNLITPAKRRQAFALVKEGFPVSLAADVDTEKAIDNPSPYEHSMLGIGTDRIGVAFHGLRTRIWIRSRTSTTTAGSTMATRLEGRGDEGCQPYKNSIYNLKSGSSRAASDRLPRLKGVPYLDLAPIYAEDLEAWEKKAGVKVSAGDALFIRTGVWARRKAAGPYLRGRAGKAAGLDTSVIPWLKQRDIAVMGSDHPQGVAPSDPPGSVHDFVLVVLGVHLFDNCDLEALADAAAARNQWQFLLTAAPLPIKGGTGSPLNPVAVF
jgi:hypothetical protein